MKSITVNVKAKAMVLSKKEYDDIESQLDIFRKFLIVFERVSEVEILPMEYSLSQYYSYSNGKYTGTLLSKQYIDTTPSIEAERMTGEICGSFGCVFISEFYIFFPMPVVIFENKSFDAFNVEIKTTDKEWKVGLIDSREEGQIINVLSNMYKKRVPKKDLLNVMSKYFDSNLIKACFGFRDLPVFTYAHVLRRVLRNHYALKEGKKYFSPIIKSIYDNWDLLLSSKDVFNMEPVKRMWGEVDSFYKNMAKHWEALREIEYIGDDIPSILTYANLYEKGIESDFGQAILKTLENKKEAESLEKTLFPMEKYIAREKGIPYEVPVTNIDPVDYFDYKIRYYQIYQSVLDDIFRKLRGVV